MPCKKPEMSKNTNRGAPEICQSRPPQRPADADREDGFWNVIAAKAHEGGEGQQHQRENLWRAKAKRDRSQQRREQCEQHVGDRAADERRQVPP